MLKLPFKIKLCSIDFHKTHFDGEIEFHEKIQDIFLRKKEITVLLQKNIYIYDLISMECKKKIK